MRTADLKGSCGYHVSISEERWAEALILGQARTRTNLNRADSSNRGDEGNAAVDLHGALGELLLLKLARDHGDKDATRYMIKHMLVLGGGKDVTGPDLVLQDSEKSCGIDVKTFDCSPWKRLFAINAAKHDELRKYNTEGYFCLLTPRFGKRGVVSKLVPYNDVSDWQCKLLRPDGSLSRNLPIADFEMRYAGEEPWRLPELRRSLHSAARIESLADDRGAGSVFTKLRKEFPLLTP